MEEGFAGLLRDKTRPSRIPPLGADVAKRVVALTLTDPPGETTHWTGAMMATASGSSISALQRIGRANGLRPHKVEQFKLSTDPKFVDKLRDVGGLYVDPPAPALVDHWRKLVGERLLILDETKPICPLIGVAMGVKEGALAPAAAAARLVAAGMSADAVAQALKSLS